MEIVVFLIHAYLYILIFEFLTEKSSGHYKWVTVLLFGLSKYVAENVIHTKNLLPLILCTLLIFYGKCIQSKYSNLQLLKYALITYGMDLALSIVMGSIFGIIGVIFEMGGKNWTNISTAIGRIIIIVLLSTRKVHLQKVKQIWILHIAFVASIVAILVEQTLGVAYKTKNYRIVDMGLACIYVAALFTTLWLLDHQKMLKIQNEYAADNKQMSQKLHRSKEILPLLADYVSNIDEAEDEKMRQKLQEVCHDYGKELSSQELNTGLFNTTGIELLDLWLQKKMNECEERNIEFNVFVNARIDKDMKQLGISDGELIRMMGDLLRNAINAVEEAGDSSEAMILAVVARDENGFVEFHIHDSGIPFSKEVLEKLGERGNTTWGTGNGIADLIESLRRVHASIEIIPEPDPEDVFTKEICIRFDGRGLIKTEHGQVSA